MDTVSSNECVSSSTGLSAEKEQSIASFINCAISTLKYAHVVATLLIATHIRHTLATELSEYKIFAKTQKKYQSINF